MTEPTPLWPAPPPRKGGRIRHGYRCPRTAPIVETVRTSPTGQALIVELCTECDATDLADRLLSGTDNGPEAA